MKYDVFISYSSKDQKVVEAMCAYLEQHKVRCFVAYRDIPKGVVWAKAIVEALDESSMMVVVFSEDFNLSDQVDREIELASEDKKPILTYRITDALFKGAKKYYLKNINWIDAFPHPEKMFDSLLENICKLIACPLIDPNPQQIIQPVPVEKTWKVGDYYNVDGKEGVVFWLDETGKHGKIVSLDQEELMWCDRVEYTKGLSGIAVDQSDGMRNLQSIMKISDWRIKYPAFAWCTDHGTGWYLPAIRELVDLLSNDEVRDSVNRALTKKGISVMLPGIGGFDYFWSSTEKTDKWSARLVGMSDGGIYCNHRFSTHSVRAVAMVDLGVTKSIEVKVNTPEVPIVKPGKPTQDNRIPGQRKWCIGDYYNVDGKKGVVFWVDESGKHGKIVSLDQAEKRWCTGDEYHKELTGIASDEYDGMKNLQSIHKISDWRNKYPAFAWCADHGDGWYLPARKELEFLLRNDEVRDAVNNQIAREGKAKFSKGKQVIYWSSTEQREWCALSVNMAEGYTYSYLRYLNLSVRAVSAF